MFVVGNFRTNPPDVEEGICELAAVLYLRSLPQDKDSDMRIRHAHPTACRVSYMLLHTFMAASGGGGNLSDAHVAILVLRE